MDGSEATPVVSSSSDIKSGDNQLLGIDHPALDKIRATHAEIGNCEKDIKRLKERLAIEAQALRDVEPGSLRLQICRYAYWSLPRVNVTDLAIGYLGSSSSVQKLKKLIGPADTKLRCDRCEEPYKAESRAEFAEALRLIDEPRPRWAEGYRLVCKQCEDAIHQERDIENNRRRIEHERLLSEAQGLPYHEFLKTTYWENLRAFMSGMVNADCLVCDGYGDVDFYHKTGRDPGACGEYDLTCLCPDCAELLMDSGHVLRRPIQRGRDDVD